MRYYWSRVLVWRQLACVLVRRFQQQLQMIYNLMESWLRTAYNCVSTNSIEVVRFRFFLERHTVVTYRDGIKLRSVTSWKFIKYTLFYYFTFKCSLRFSMPSSRCFYVSSFGRDSEAQVPRTCDGIVHHIK